MYKNIKAKLQRDGRAHANACSRKHHGKEIRVRLNLCQSNPEELDAISVWFCA